MEVLFRLLFLQTNCLKVSFFQITNRLVEDVIASPWISPPELKYLSASFHDIGVDFYKIKHLKMVEHILVLKVFVGACLLNFNSVCLA